MTDPLPEHIADMRSRGLSDATIRNRRSIITTAESQIGRSALDMSLHDLRVWLGRTTIKPSSRRTERAHIIAYFRFLHDEGFRDDDPTEKLTPITVSKGRPRPFSAGQIDRMLTTGAYRRTRAMILLGYYQGFRVSSICRVHGHDIDLDEHTIRTIGKGGKDRVLPLHPVIADLAQTMPRDSWWFPARRGASGHIKPSGVTDLITRAKKRAGIIDGTLTPHSLRHAFGTDLVEQEVDIRVVQELMMHESLSTTQIYTHVSDRRKHAGIRALEARPIPARSGRQAPGPDLAEAA